MEFGELGDITQRLVIAHCRLQEPTEAPAKWKVPPILILNICLVCYRTLWMSCWLYIASLNIEIVVCNCLLMSISV